MLKSSKILVSINNFRVYPNFLENVNIIGNKIKFREGSYCMSLRQSTVKKYVPVKWLHTGTPKYLFKKKEKDIEDKALLYFEEFDKKSEKNKKAYLEAFKAYQQTFGTKRGYVDFIKIALRHMKDFGVEKDIEVYKKLLSILPKGPLVCKSALAAEMVYHPRQQYVVLDLLEQMEKNGVRPDVELGDILKSIFGESSYPCKKYYGMRYWSVKFQNLSPWPKPEVMHTDPYILAKLAIERITSVDIKTSISILDTSDIADSIDKTWIVSAQSPTQINLLANHPKNEPVIVEGGDIIWIGNKPIEYFILKGDIEPPPYNPPEDFYDISSFQSPFLNPQYEENEKKEASVHEQDDGTIYGVCATGTSSKDSLLSWVRLLQQSGNPVLENVQVLFRFKSGEKSPVLHSDALVTQND